MEVGRLKKPATTNASPRRPRAVVSVLGTTQLHLRNPLVVAFWSVMFPGLGHLLLSKYIRGFLLFIWEIIINVEAHVNLGILYSFLGRFDVAKSVVDTRWLLMYIPTYLFAIWDSYRTCADLNKQFVLTAREDAEIKPNAINAIEINYLDRSSPWAAVAWSMMTPGAGQLIIHRIVAAFFIMIWWIAVIYFSKLLPAIQFSMTGRVQDARAILNPQWFLNVPSLYFFAMYDAYVNTVESNKLFEWEQAKFLKKEYQDGRFPMPFENKTGGESMYVISTFEHSINLEAAVTALEMKGIAKQSILAAPLDKKTERRHLFDTLHASDGLSTLDVPMILASILTLLGAIYGFVLPPGPVLCGLIGMAAGFALGLLLKLFTKRKFQDAQNDRKAAEVVLIVACAEGQADMVKDTLWENDAFGVSKLSLT
jgi:TM2 domain-containing membrane protein YozV